ncbi:MAG: glycosyltransferase family 4 protein [Planctomycetaceae bacterium]|nr:glycosyltransferase family 4 protein [Planctomycetaceae bacterium]
MESKKKHIVFDISNFSGQTTMAGVLRYIVEVLSRLVKRNEFDITLISSLPEEEFCYANLRRFIDFDLPFASYEGKDYSSKQFLQWHASDEKQRVSFLRKLETGVRKCFGKNKFVHSVIEFARAVKWKIKPPKFLSDRQRSPYIEELIRNADIYISPFHRLIPELDVNPSIKKVLVVHDVIPILFADLYVGFSHFRQNPWESITSDVIVLADSESTKRDLIKCYPQVSEEQVSVVYLATDERFKPCDDTEKINAVLQKYKIPPECPYIFSVATFDIRKNFDTVIRSFFRLIIENGSEFPNVHLVLTGANGWNSQVFYNQYGSMPEEIKNRVIFTGYAADVDIPFLYSGAKCFCYMSIYEGFGLPLLEAMKSGCPVIAADNSSLPEVAGDAAILLDAKDEIGLTKTFRRVLSDNTLRQELIQKGFEQAKKFSWERSVEQIVERIMSDNP